MQVLRSPGYGPWHVYHWIRVDTQAIKVFIRVRILVGNVQVPGTIRGGGVLPTERCMVHACKLAMIVVSGKSDALCMARIGVSLVSLPAGSIDAIDVALGHWVLYLVSRLSSGLLRRLRRSKSDVAEFMRYSPTGYSLLQVDGVP